MELERELTEVKSESSKLRSTNLESAPSFSKGIYNRLRSIDWSCKVLSRNLSETLFDQYHGAFGAASARPAGFSPAAAAAAPVDRRPAAQPAAAAAVSAPRSRPPPAPAAPSRRAPAHARSSARRYSQGVRTKTIKKSARNIIEKYYQRLTLDFHTNKRVVDEVAILPSKRMRNKIAGFVTHLMKRIQRGPVRNISLKLQEEERERRLDFVPEVSAIDTELIEIDSETKAMLDFLQMENLPGVQVATVSACCLRACLPVRMPACARARVTGE